MMPALQIRPSMRLRMRLAQAAVRRERDARERVASRDADRELLLALESAIGRTAPIDVRLRVLRAAREADRMERLQLVR